MVRSMGCWLLASLVILDCNGGSDEEASAKVDRFVRGEMAAQHIPGLSLAVTRNGRIVLAKGYGLANIEHQVAVKPETVFQSGSVGKQFTATAVMMLVEEGRMRLKEGD